MTVTQEALDEIREREEWDKAAFVRWWRTYRAYHSADEYPEDAPKEVRQAFTAALVMLREKQEKDARYIKRLVSEVRE